MVGKSKVIGVFLIFAGIVVFTVNIGLWSPPFISALLPSWFWNPLSLITPHIVGNIPVISGGFGWMLNKFFGLVLYPILLGLLGFILVK